MTEGSAFRVCESVASCAGFTYSTPAAPAERRQLKHTIHFKTSGVGASGAEVSAMLTLALTLTLTLALTRTRTRTLTLTRTSTRDGTRG